MRAGLTEGGGVLSKGEVMSELSNQLRQWATGPMCRNPKRTDTCNMLLRAADEVERLQAIVDQLPKTADGVTKLAGDNVFRCHEGVVEKRWVNWSPQSDPWPGYQASYGLVGPPIAVDECYSTRDAAEAAKEK